MSLRNTAASRQAKGTDILFNAKEHAQPKGGN